MFGRNFGDAFAQKSVLNVKSLRKCFVDSEKQKLDSNKMGFTARQ